MSFPNPPLERRGLQYTERYATFACREAIEGGSPSRMARRPRLLFASRTIFICHAFYSLKQSCGHTFCYRNSPRRDVAFCPFLQAFVGRATVHTPPSIAHTPGHSQLRRASTSTPIFPLPATCLEPSFDRGSLLLEPFSGEWLPKRLDRVNSTVFYSFGVRYMYAIRSRFLACVLTNNRFSTPKERVPLWLKGVYPLSQGDTLAPLSPLTSQKEGKLMENRGEKKEKNGLVFGGIDVETRRYQPLGTKCLYCTVLLSFPAWLCDRWSEQTGMMR